MKGPCGNARPFFTSASPRAVCGGRVGGSIRSQGAADLSRGSQACGAARSRIIDKVTAPSGAPFASATVAPSAPDSSRWVAKA